MAKISQTVNGQVPQTVIISRIKRRLATNAFFMRRRMLILINTLYTRLLIE